MHLPGAAVSTGEHTRRRATPVGWLDVMINRGGYVELFSYWWCPVDGSIHSGATPELEERVEEHELHLHGLVPR